jgi:hypothetical protein
LVTLFVLVPASAIAQFHAHGTAWIRRNAPIGTMVHARGDSLCTIEFPASCHHGMMSPDSLYCSWQSVSPEDMPAPMARYCVAGFRCEIRDEHGQLMMPGHMTPRHLFRSPLELTIHYDPAAVAALGVDPANLTVTTWINGAPTMVTGAVHDQDVSRFTMSATQVADWYGISDRTALPTGVEGSTWGQIKATYR